MSSATHVIRPASHSGSEEGVTWRSCCLALLYTLLFQYRLREAQGLCDRLARQLQTPAAPQERGSASSDGRKSIITSVHRPISKWSNTVKTVILCNMITHTHTQTRTHTHRHAHTHTTHTHTHTQTHTQTRTHTHRHARTHARTHTHIHIHRHARTHTDTHAHVRTHTHAHTHTYTRTYTRTHTHLRVSK